MCGSGDKPPKPSENGASSCPAGSTTQTCPLKKPHLVELIEVVARSPEGTVVGAGAASGKLATKTTRTDKKGAAYKQFINLGKDIDGADKRHPEYSRAVELRARVEGEGSLSGLTVNFRYVLTPGKDRPAGMTGGVKEGFSSDGGAATTSSSTDAEGWSGTVEFHLSQYAGDQYEVFAQLSDGGAEKSIGKFEVWRKFWYQMTRATTHAVPAPAKSVTAYAAVCADMLAATEVTFTKATAPAGTFYPAYMVRKNGGDGEESVIGNHNRDQFYLKFSPEPGKPVKGHLIICRNQWDPAAAPTGLVNESLTTDPSAEITVALGQWNAGIVKPALKGSLVSFGQWTQGANSGAITDADIVIEKTRSGIDRFKVKLPAGAPAPTAAAPVNVKLKLNYGTYWGGESNDHQMLIVYDGDDKAFNQAVSHEFGHGFALTPSDGKQTAPLTKHATYYYNDQGGQGPHCHTDATLVVDASTSSGKRWSGGTCIMYHQLSPSVCKQVFCAACEPHLKLKDMSTIKTAR